MVCSRRCGCRTNRFIYSCALQTNYICPLCSKSLGDMEHYFASIDELLEREQMPEEYKDIKSLIYCSDCEHKSTTKFHFVYHKVYRRTIQLTAANDNRETNCSSVSAVPTPRLRIVQHEAGAPVPRPGRSHECLSGRFYRTQFDPVGGRKRANSRPGMTLATFGHGLDCETNLSK